MFTRRHYRAIATMLRSYRVIMVDSQWQLIVDAFIQMFTNDTPRFDRNGNSIRFDRERFLMWVTE